MTESISAGSDECGGGVALGVWLVIAGEGIGVAGSGLRWNGSEPS